MLHITHGDEMEDRVFMGDLSFARAVRTLARAGLPPLLLTDPGGANAPLARHGVTLTPFGRDVLAGHADHASVKGVDRWVGGVHLQGFDVEWRWDAEEESCGDADVQAGIRSSEFGSTSECTLRIRSPS